MAEGTKLVLEFNTAEEKTTTMTFRYAKPAATVANVKALMNKLIEHKSVFETEPISAKSAKLVTTSETVFDLYEGEAVSYFEGLRRGLIEPEADTDMVEYQKYLAEHPKEEEVKN